MHSKLRWVPLLLLVLLAGSLVGSAGLVGSARADASPPSNSGFLADNDHILAFNGYLTWGGQYQSVTNGSQVYAGGFVLVLYDLTTQPIVVTVSLQERGNNVSQTTTVIPSAADQVNIAVPQSNSWVPTTLWVGGTPQYYSVAVPISLLPNSITTVGGLDLLTLGVLSEALISLALAVAFAYWCMRRALWAPKFSLLIWGHVILIGIASAVLIDFQFVDALFAGWSPLVYAVFLFPVFWAFSLSYFNKAPTSQLQRANAPLAGRLSFDFWMIRTARDARGRFVLIDETWRGFWARIWGHHVVLIPEEARLTTAEPFIADVKNRKILSRVEIVRQVRRPSPAKASPADDFDVIPASVDGRPIKGDRLPHKLLFTPVGEPVDVTWPRWTIHRDIEVPQEVDVNGNVIVPAHRERRLSRPHYTSGSAHLKLAPIHYRSAQSVVAGWRGAEDLAQVLSTTSLDNEALKSTFETQVASKVRERLLAREALLGRGTSDLDELEAAQEAERSKDTLSPLDALFGKSLATPLAPATDAEGRQREGKKR
jgi:hypothetical protein